MILKNHVERFGYAQLLIADYHKEYPIPKPTNVKGSTQCYIILDTDSLGFAIDDLGRDGDKVIADFVTAAFGDLETRYNGYWDPHMSLWLVQGSLEDLDLIWRNFRATLEGGPQGADDDTYDYWPNAFEMLLTMAKDLAVLTGDRARYAESIARLVYHVEALHGPLEDWEAEGMRDAATSVYDYNPTELTS